jgi:hypothetical protein
MQMQGKALREGIAPVFANNKTTTYILPAYSLHLQRGLYFTSHKQTTHMFSLRGTRGMRERKSIIFSTHIDTTTWMRVCVVKRNEKFKKRNETEKL